MIAIICTDGQLGLREIEKECVVGKWIPLLIFRKTINDKIFLPIFNLPDIARKFINRNLPKNWKHGCVYLCDDDIAKIIKKNWEFEVFDFPRKVNESPDYKLDFEIHEFEEMPDFKLG